MEKDWNKEGNDLFNKGDYSQAIDCYDKALAQNDNYEWLHYNKGISLHELGRYEEAINCFDKTIALKNDYVYAYNGKGNALLALKKYKEAIKWFDKAIALKNDYVFAHIGKGRALYKQDEYKEAIEYYDKAIALQNDYPYVYYDKGDALFDLGKYEEAIVCYDKAIELKNDYAYAYANKASTLEKLGKDKEAIEIYDLALAIDPSLTNLIERKNNIIESLSVRANYLSKPAEHSLYTIVQVLRVLIIVLAGVLGYFMFISDTEIDFRIEWNMFNSILKYPLLVIGFLLSLGTKFDVIPVLVTKNEWGNVTKVERDYDLDSSMDGCFMQIIGYFLLGPIIGAAMIYYPLMSIVYLFGKIFPLLILVFFIFTLLLFYKWQNVRLIKNSSSGSLAMITLFGGGILWLLTYTWMPKEDPALQIIHIATGVFIAVTILLFIFGGKKKPAPKMSMETPLEELITATKKVQVPVISSKFIIAYIVCLLIIICIYTFKVVS